jgi:hypothetical protein
MERYSCKSSDGAAEGMEGAACLHVQQQRLPSDSEEQHLKAKQTSIGAQNGTVNTGVWVDCVKKILFDFNHM